MTTYLEPPTGNTTTSESAARNIEPATKTRDGALSPLVLDAWYILAPRTEVDRTLRQRWIVGEPVCFYRTEGGQAVAMDDRCAHRRFPLSEGHLEGDTIRCGYHGFVFDCKGACVSVPTLPARSGEEKLRARGSVRSYPVVERGPWVWIWTGRDTEAADPNLIPWPIPDEPERCVYGYKLFEGNYQMVHENLLDLSHVCYLHGFFAPEQVSEVPDNLPEEQIPAVDRDRSIGWTRANKAKMSVYGLLVGDDPAAETIRTDRVVSVVPSMNYNMIQFAPTNPDSVKLRTAWAMNGITPIDGRNTHYFWALWVDGPIVSDDAWTTVHDNLTTLFDEDADAFKKMQVYVDCNDQLRPELNVPSDAYALKFRRKLAAAAAADKK